MDLDLIKTTSIYFIRRRYTHGPNDETSQSALITIWAPYVGTPFQFLIPDLKPKIYKRWWSSSIDGWNVWYTIIAQL